MGGPQGLDQGRPDPMNVPPADPERRLHRIGCFLDGAFPGAVTKTGRPHINAITLGIMDERRNGIETHRP
jgi:hypothetical protein